jgi:hypothetical protein
MLRSHGSKRSLLALPILYLVWALRDSGNIQAMPAITGSPNVPLTDLYEDNQLIAKRSEPLSVRPQHEKRGRFLELEATVLLDYGNTKEVMLSSQGI